LALEFARYLTRLTFPELARAISRETVAGWTLNNRAASAAVLSSLDNHLSNLSLLSLEKLRTASTDATFLACGIQPCFGPFSQHGPLELRESPDHMHHHPPRRRGRIDGLSQVRNPARNPQASP